MKEKKQINVDEAWENLYERLEKDGLIPGTPVRVRNIKRPAAALYKWAAVILLLLTGGLAYVQLSVEKPSQELFYMENLDRQNALVTTLDDGSIIYLDEHSSLRYPGNFANDRRIVNFKGNAMFNVRKDTSHPFIVETDKAIVEVLGTVFSINTFPDQSIEVSVKQGAVRITPKNRQEQVLVRPGEAVYLKEGNIEKVSGADDSRFSRYTERMRFKDEKLGNIVRVINSFSQKQIILSDEKLRNRVLTVAFDNNTTDSMAELICLALQLQQNNRKDTVYIFQP